MEVTAWRGGEVAAAGLEVTSWALAWDASRQVQGQATLTIADPGGKLAPWGMSDPLGPGGSRLQVTWVSGSSGTRVPLGWWRIRRPEPHETWRVYGKGTSVTRVPGGGSVTVDADEMTCVIDMSRLDAESSPAAGATCLGEVRRLVGDIVPVVVDPAVTDRLTSPQLVYGESRMDAVEDHLASVMASHRMGGDGSLQVVPFAATSPVWTLVGGSEGVLIDLGRSLSDDGLYNAIVSTGTAPDGSPLIAREYLTVGPLAYGGPFGKVPAFHHSVATTAEGVAADARTVLATQVSTGTVDLPITCLTHPGLQVHDTVVVVAATTVGDQPLTGRVMSITMRSATSDTGTTPAKSMSITVRVPVEALEAVAQRVRGG